MFISSKERFGVVRYRIIGDDSAPTFFQIDDRTGEIKLKELLREDTETEYQIRVEAFDNGTPFKSDVAIVKVTVNRNLNAPRFSQTSITVNILYTQELGTAITKVSATDADQQVSVFKPSLHPTT